MRSLTIGLYLVALLLSYALTFIMGNHDACVAILSR